MGTLHHQPDHLLRVDLPAAFHDRRAGLSSLTGQDWGLVTSRRSVTEFCNEPQRICKVVYDQVSYGLWIYQLLEYAGYIYSSMALETDLQRGGGTFSFSRFDPKLVPKPALKSMCPKSHTFTIITMMNSGLLLLYRSVYHRCTMHQASFTSRVLFHPMSFSTDRQSLKTWS